jgi:hypothetical protein
MLKYACIFLFLVQLNGYAETLSDLQALTDTEKSVLDQLRAGSLSFEPRDSRPESMVLRGKFVSDILALQAGQLKQGMLTLSGFRVKGVVYDNAPIPFGLMISGCIFDSMVTIRGGIDGNFDIVGSKFNGDCDLSELHVKGHLYFIDSGKESSRSPLWVLLRNTNVDSDTRINGLGSCAPDAIVATGLTTKSLDCSFGQQTCPRVVFTGLRTANAKFASISDSNALISLAIDEAVIENNLEISTLEIYHLNASGITVGRSMTIGTGCAVKGSLDLFDATLGSLTIELPLKNNHPAFTNENSLDYDYRTPFIVRMEGFSFKNLSVRSGGFVQSTRITKSETGSRSNSRGDVVDTESNAKGPSGGHAPAPVAGRVVPVDLTLQFLERAHFYQPAFVAYDRLLREEGLNDKADAVNAAMHAKYRQRIWENADGLSGHLSALLPISIDKFQDLVFGYGRSVREPLVCAGIFILVGSCVFWKTTQMEKIKGEDSGAYSGFWYSLELFLPVVDLGVAKGWRPKHGKRVLLFYARIHQLAGWIIIPAVIGNLTGSFK